MALRSSSRVTNGSIGWVDNVPCQPINIIIDDLFTTSTEWNLYVCPEKDVRHSFVVHKDFRNRCYYFYDYQGSTIFEDRKFSTTRVFNALKGDRSHGFKVRLGQRHCIDGEDYSNLCMKNSAFVMKYRCAPKDKKFNAPFDKNKDLETARLVVDLTI